MQARFLQEELATWLWEETFPGAIHFFFLPTAVAVHCWRATSAYTWSDVDHVLLTTSCFSKLSCKGHNPPEAFREKPGQAFGLLLLLPISCSTRGQKAASAGLSGFAFLLEAESRNRPNWTCARETRDTLRAACLEVFLFHSSSFALKFS